jgi:hypothetical protein
VNHAATAGVFNSCRASGENDRDLPAVRVRQLPRPDAFPTSPWA